VKIEAYPAQEPPSALGAAYQQRVLALGQGIEGEDIAYGADPYQSLAVFRAERASGDVLVFFHGGGWTKG
jgi:arylformamidase